MSAQNLAGLWAGLSCGVQLLAATAAAQTPSGGATAAPALEEVVVTAQRREERLQDVPISVGVFSQEQLDAQGLRNIDDLTRFSPGVTFIRAGTGANGNYNDANSDVNIRGIDSSSGASTVAVYIDDTPIQSRRIGFGTFNTFPAIFDLDHVEVLRGPQGTLFGASSEGGNVRFISPQPGLDKYSSYVRTELASTSSGDPTYEAGAAFGGPIINDKLGFRVSASYRREGGWVDRVDRLTQAPVEKASNWTSYASARLAFKWAATAKLTVSPSFYVQETQINDTAIWWPELSSSSTHLNGNKQANPSTDPFYLAALRIDWNLGPVQLFSNTSFYSRHQHSVSDYSQYDRAAYYNVSQLFATCPPPPPAALPPCAYLPGPGDAGSSYFTDKQNNLYQEIRLQSSDPNARVSWTAGVYYARLNENSSEFIVDPTLDANFPPPASIVCYIPCPGGLIYYQPYFRVIDKQLAGYGEADVKLTGTLKAIVGLRVSHATYTGSSLYGGPFVAPVPVLGNNSATENPVTPRLGLSWQPDRDSLYYATAANGYRVGNLNVDVGNLCGPDLTAIGLTSAPGTSRSDKLWSYELGAKNTLLERTLQLNLSVFLIDWKDIQQSFYLPTCGLQFATNLGRARSRGGDLELTYHPIPALMLYFDAAYTDAKYTGTACASPTVDCTSPGSPFLHIVTEGDRLPGPPWSFVGSAEYSWVWGAGSKPYARIDYQYSTAQSAILQVQNPANGSSDPTQTGLPVIKSLSMRFGWRRGGWDLSLFGQNLTNSNPVMFRTRDIIAGWDQTHFDRGLRPRSLGVTGTWRF